MEENARRENSLYYRNERCFPFRFRGPLGWWQNPDTKEWLRSCVIITGEPNELVGQIHDRMPVILPPETDEQWLSEQTGKEILRPFPPEAMKIRAVSRRVNKPENDDPGILEKGEMEQVERLI
jgi:putative SOS response-associated peptidase YedK